MAFISKRWCRWNEISYQACLVIACFFDYLFWKWEMNSARERENNKVEFSFNKEENKNKIGQYRKDQHYCFPSRIFLLSSSSRAFTSDIQFSSAMPSVVMAGTACSHFHFPSVFGYRWASERSHFSVSEVDNTHFGRKSNFSGFHRLSVRYVLCFGGGVGVKIYFARKGLFTIHKQTINRPQNNPFLASSTQLWFTFELYWAI